MRSRTRTARPWRSRRSDQARRIVDAAVGDEVTSVLAVTQVPVLFPAVEGQVNRQLSRPEKGSFDLVNKPSSPLADPSRRIEGGHGGCSARSWRHALGSLRCPSSNGARRVVEQVNDLGDLRSHIALAIGHDEALQ